MKGKSFFKSRQSSSRIGTQPFNLSDCINGDKKVQEEFVIEFTALIYWTIKRTLTEKGILFDVQDIQELHNSVFLALFDRNCKKLSQYSGKKGCSLSSWIRLITVRVVLDHLRKTKRSILETPEKVISFDTLFNVRSGSPEPHRMIEEKEQEHRIAKGLNLLKHRERLFLKLHFFKGLSLEETADILGLTKNNAYCVKYRAINHLRDILLKNGD